MDYEREKRLLEDVRELKRTTELLSELLILNSRQIGGLSRGMLIVRKQIKAVWTKIFSSEPPEDAADVSLRGHANELLPLPPGVPPKSPGVPGTYAVERDMVISDEEKQKLAEQENLFARLVEWLCNRKAKREKEKQMKAQREQDKGLGLH